MDRWNGGDETALKSLIERYQKPIFSLILYLAGCDREKTFAIAVSLFAKAIRLQSSNQKDCAFLQTLIRFVIEQCRNTPPAPSFDLSDFSALPAPKRESLRIVKEALFALSFENKSLLLLRDQLQLPYVDISAVSGIPMKDVRSKTAQARSHLMDKVREILERARGNDGLR